MSGSGLPRAAWRKSSRSGGNEGGSNCVEVAAGSGGRLAIRDSKDPGGGQLAVSPAAWRAFVAGLKKA